MSRDYRFELTDTRTITFVLKHPDAENPPRHLFREEFEFGTYYVTFTLKAFDGYLLHWSTERPPEDQNQQQSSPADHLADQNQEAEPKTAPPTANAYNYQPTQAPRSDLPRGTKAETIPPARQTNQHRQLTQASQTDQQ